MGMKTQLTDAEKIRRLPWSIAQDAMNSTFCTFTIFGAVFILFLDELGLPKTQIGFLLSLLPFCGLLALFIAPAVARMGLKRTFIISWGTRKFIVAFLLLTPWILSRFGLHPAFMYVAVILTIFAVCRAVAETAMYQWLREIIPDSIRGRYAAIDSAVIALAGCAAVIAAGYVMGHFSGLNRFMILFAVGVVFGLIAVCCSFFIPGGAPVREAGGSTGHFKKMRKALQDRNFRFYLGGTGATVLAVSFLSFIPLFMKEQVGLTERNVVLLQMGILLGGLLSGYLWGWASDRYGGKPVAGASLYMMALLPFCWLLIPRHSVWSNPAAMAIAFLYGFVSFGWLIGSGRLLFVGIVPPEGKTEYIAVYYAWMGFVGGCVQLFAGRFLDACRGITGKFFIFSLDPYTPLLTGSLCLMVVGALLIRQVRADSKMPPGRFVQMFLRGNPFMAIGLLVRYNLVKEERSRVSTTERLGQARSPLNVDELLEALFDPGFNVRYEAIISTARMHPDDRLLDALIGILNGSNPDLSTAAAWALGKIGDRKAVEPLRKSMTSGYPLLQARSARALATLGDVHSVPYLLDRFKNERDSGLRVAYASALGSFRTAGITRELLAFLRESQNDDVRRELTFALARVVGNERRFVRLLREVRSEAGTAVSQVMVALRRRIGKAAIHSSRLMELIGDCEEAFAGNDAVHGAELLSVLIDNLPMEEFEEACALVLRECAGCLRDFRATRIEYIVLSIHTINTALNSLKQRRR
jgi:HEAT repeat protein/MFS family permease